jgi:hypothetical protein
MPYGKLALDTIETSGNLDIAGNVAVTGNVTVSADLFVSGSQVEPLVLATAQTASGTSVDFTGIPSWVKRITVMFRGVSTNGTSNVLIQLGSGSATTSGYLGASSVLTATVTSANYTNGLAVVRSNDGTSVVHGVCTAALVTGNTWAMAGTLAFSNGAGTVISASTIALSGALDLVRITTVNGTDTFDAGTVNIMYE